MNQITPVTPTERKPLPPSPCVGICTMDGPYCYGCGRTLDEIGGWGALPSAAKQNVWAALPARLISMGVRTFRLAPEPAALGHFMARTFRETTGTWQLSGSSLAVNFTIDSSARPESRSADGWIEAANNNGRLALRQHDRIRAFGLARAPDATAMDAVAIVLPKARARRENPATVKAVTDDATRLDLALPDQYLSAMLTAATPQVQLAGLDWSEVRDRVRALLAVGRGRATVSNALAELDTGTVEIACDPGPADRNAPADITLASAFACCAIFEADDPDWLRHALAPDL